MSYIEKRLAEQQAKIQHCATEGIRIPPGEKDKLMALTKQKFTLQGQVNSGKITEEQYKDYMLKQLAKDEKLLQVLNQKGFSKQAQIVQERIATIHSEIDE